MHQPLIFGHLVPTDSEMAVLHQQGIITAFKEVNNNGGLAGRYVYLITFSFVLNATNISEQLSWFLKSNDVLALISSVFDISVASELFNIANNAGILFISPRGPQTQQFHTPFNPLRVFLGISPRDEAFAITRFARDQIGSKEIGLIYETGPSGVEAVSAMSMAAEEYSISLVCSSVYTSEASLSVAIYSVLGTVGVDAIVISGSHYTADAVNAIKQMQPHIPVFVMLRDLDSNQIQQSLHTGVTGVFMTQFVPSPTSSTDVISVHFRAALAEMNSSSHPTTTMIEGYLVAQLLTDIVAYIPSSTITPSMLTNSLYSTSVFNLDSLQVGSYVNSNCQLWTGSRDCQCDQGSRNVWMVQLSSNNSNTIETIQTGFFHFDTCGVDFTPVVVNRDQSSITFIAGIAVAIAFVCSAVVGTLAYFKLSKRRQRLAAIQAAPKENVTIVFTDVQDSTKLWDMCPGMRDALETHNEVMRELITIHQGYEVKTQGDSFMVAFDNATAAVEWSLAVQHHLMTVDWPDDILAQKSCEIVYADHCNENGSPAHLFRGLRVRIGVHTGFPELEYNPRTNSVDYFGPIVNGAARIEALGAGGQVLISIETHSLLKINPDWDVTVLGFFPLKGMCVEQEIVQLSSQQLATRVFPTIDRNKSLMQITGPPTCDICSRPLQCMRCGLQSSSDWIQQRTYRSSQCGAAPTSSRSVRSPPTQRSTLGTATQRSAHTSTGILSPSQTIRRYMTSTTVDSSDNDG
jgi:class 3 adenylate cyclase/ABC-type branched-subunit amino acid transport system substrate-binding protein